MKLVIKSLLSLVILTSSGCAVVSHQIKQVTPVCKTLNDTFQFTFVYRQKIRGSHHTPFAYGNVSVWDREFLVETPTKSDVVAVKNTKVWFKGKPVKIESGFIKFGKRNIEIDMLLNEKTEHEVTDLHIKENVKYNSTLSCK